MIVSVSGSIFNWSLRTSPFNRTLGHRLSRSQRAHLLCQMIQRFWDFRNDQRLLMNKPYHTSFNKNTQYYNGLKKSKTFFGGSLGHAVYGIAGLIHGHGLVTCANIRTLENDLTMGFVPRDIGDDVVQRWLLDHALELIHGQADALATSQLNESLCAQGLYCVGIFGPATQKLGQGRDTLGIHGVRGEFTYQHLICVRGLMRRHQFLPRPRRWED